MHGNTKNAEVLAADGIKYSVLVWLPSIIPEHADFPTRVPAPRCVEESLRLPST